MTKQPKQVLLLPGEAAEVLGMTREGVRRAENRGDLPAMKTRSGWRFFTLADVEAFRAERVRRLEVRLTKAKTGGAPLNRRGGVAR